MRIAIIGAGMAGVLAAIELREAGSPTSWSTRSFERFHAEMAAPRLDAYDVRR